MSSSSKTTVSGYRTTTTISIKSERSSVPRESAVAVMAPEVAAGSRYQQGWARGGEDTPATSGLSKNVVRLAGKSYEEVKAACRQSGALYEDPDFPADDRSLFPQYPPQGMPKITWKRPPVSFE
jgi:hypothetical protein